MPDWVIFALVGLYVVIMELRIAELRGSSRMHARCLIWVFQVLTNGKDKPDVQPNG